MTTTPRQAVHQPLWPTLPLALRLLLAALAGMLGALAIGIAVLFVFTSRLLPEIAFGLGALLVPITVWRVLKSSTSPGLTTAITISLSAPLLMYAVVMGLMTVTLPDLAEARGNAPLSFDPAYLSPFTLLVFYVPALAYLATSIWCGVRGRWALLVAMLVLAPVLTMALVMTMWMCAVAAALSG